MDTTVNPAEDFYRYATGGWIDSHPIPEDRSWYDVSKEIQDKVDQQVICIINDLLSHKQKPGTIEYKLAKLYQSGMDTAKAYAEGLTPIQFILDSIDNIKTVSDIQNGIALLQHNYINTPIIIECGPNIKNTDYFIMKIYYYGLAMFDREYYINDDLSDIADAYKKYVTNTLRIYGLDSISATQTAETIYNVEYEIARITPDASIENDPSQYEILTLEELSNIMPVIDWNTFFTKMNCRTPKEIMLCCGSDFIINMNKLFETIPVDDWKLYFKFMTLDLLSEYASMSYRKEVFEFYKKTLNGEENELPRQYRVLAFLNEYIKDIIGKLYVERYYSESTTKDIASLASNIKSATKERITAADWLSDTTKQYALEKLDALTLKIGHPDSWLNYSDLQVDDSYINNIINIYQLSCEYLLNHSDEFIDRTEWISAPQTANAYNYIDLNCIEINASILQPPFYYPNGDDAVNYGAIGALIAHEITHGFDNNGAQLDKKGSLYNWWTTKDSIEFKERSLTLIDRYNSFVVIDTMHADGEYTLGENIADLGGLEIAYQAFTKTEQWKDQTKLIDGFTPDQRFFISYAQSWAGIYRDEAIINQTITNEHPINKYRVEGPLPSVDAFTKAFNIKPGDKYYLPDSLKTHIW